MECENCGAPLREGARFCNKCGATQVAEVTGSQQDAPTSGDAGSSGRARRPPRVPRTTDAAPTASFTPVPTSTRSHTAPVATDILDVTASEPSGAAAAQNAAPVMVDNEVDSTELAEPELTDFDESEVTEVATEDATPEAVQPGAEPAANETASASPSTEKTADESASELASADVAPVAAAPSGSPESAAPEAAPAWEDADTVEYSVVLQRGQSLDAVPATPQPTDMPALDELARAQSAQGAQSTQGAQGAQGDALPWPLPASIIVGGRYRVEEALTTVPDAPGAENVYRVQDLQGYERCWSCGTEHGEAGATDRFCQTCGADMLSRDYLMHERRLDGATIEVADDGAPEEQLIASFAQGARLYHILPRAEEPPLFPRGVRVVAAMATDTGASRAGEENEDSAGILTFCVASDSRIEPLTLCVVADGLGGHASGQEASRLAVRVLSEHILRSVTLPYVSTPISSADDAAAFEAGLIPALTDGIEAANKALCARNKKIRADMGATCVAVLLHRDTAYFANAGDSRGYVLEDEGLRRITTDHSLVEQLIAGGLIPPEERYTHPQRNQIFRSLGDEPKVALDTFTQKLRPGMRLLLCSDGLWEMVRDDEMARILRETASPQQACDVLISAANDNGGEDNISAVVVDIYA